MVVKKQMPGDTNDGVRRLCRLIDGTTEADAVSLTKNRERSLLISLSKVLRGIRSWNHEQWLSGSEDDGDEMEDNEQGRDGSDSRHECLKLVSEDEECLLRIIAKLILLLNMESQYARELAGKTLVAATEVIASSGRVWQKFIHLLCDCFVLAFSNSLQYSSPLAFEDGKLSCDRLTFDVLKYQLKNSNWNTVAGILGVFHAILKCLKEQDDKQHLESYIDSLGSCISKVSWELLDTIQAHGSYVGHMDSVKGAFVFKHAEQTEQWILFLGKFVQLLSSLVDPCVLGEAPADCQHKNQILQKVLDLVPKVLHWCLHEDWKCKSLRILPYLRHKTLILMIRLSSQISFESATLFLWLQLLHEYYEDLLMEPLYLLDSSDNNSLEGSPFRSSFDDQETRSPSRHLRGQAVFLFLRCCFSLIVQQEACGFDCICMRQNWCLTHDINSAEGCCAPRRGLLELSKWLQGQVSFDVASQLKLEVKNRIMFASFFIQLYMHEDDMLFEVLLLSLSIFNFAGKRIQKVAPGSQDVRDDALSHVSGFFNPAILFYVFLSNLQYDHRLLIDYLISKDSGTRSAEYLLRCLRAVCNSWDFFLELSSDQDTVRHACKKQKLILKRHVSYHKPSSVSGEDECALLLKSLDFSDFFERCFGKAPQKGSVSI